MHRALLAVISPVMRRAGPATGIGVGRSLRALLLPAIVIWCAGCGGGSGAAPGPSGPAAVFREMPVPVSGNTSDSQAPGSWPDDIAADAQGNIWFAMQHADEIGRMTPEGAYTGFPVPTHGSSMDSIAVDEGRKTVWVSQMTGNNIVRLDMTTGSTVEIPVPTPNARPGDLALGPDGTVWFTEGYDIQTTAAGKLGRVDPNSNSITEIAPPAPRGSLDGIATDGQGAVWFAEFADNRIARYAGGTFTEFELPSPSSVPTNIALDAAGRVWVTEQARNVLGLFDPASQTWREYAIPSPNSSPAGIAIDASGNVWFAEINANKIGVLPAGKQGILEFRIPTPNSHPEDIRPIGNGIYFSERYGNRIAQISVPGLTH